MSNQPADDADKGHLAFDERFLRQVAEVMSETGLTEVELKSGERSVRLARTPAAVHMHTLQGFAPIPAAGFAGPGSMPVSQPGEAAAPAPAAPIAKNLVTAPMVGTAYLAPEPGKPDFIKPGDSVREGQTLLIIEAMKVMNPIPAPRAGTVRRILVENGAPIEFGEPLVELD